MYHDHVTTEEGMVGGTIISYSIYIRITQDIIIRVKKVPNVLTILPSARSV